MFLNLNPRSVLVVAFCLYENINDLLIEIIESMYVKCVPIQLVQYLLTDHSLCFLSFAPGFDKVNNTWSRHTTFCLSMDLVHPVTTT